MTIKINLLPWRKINRDNEKRKIINLLLITLLSTALICVVFSFHFSVLINKKQKKNNAIMAKIVNFNKVLKEIKKIEDRRNKLANRLDLLRNISEERVLIVHLFDELSKLIPKEIFLNRIKSSSKLVTFYGFSESNQAISNLIKRIEINPWMSNPNLIEIKKDEETSYNSRFILNFTLMNKS